MTMKHKKIKVEIPEGYKVESKDLTTEGNINSDEQLFVNIRVKLVPEKKSLPKTWEELCKSKHLPKKFYAQLIGDYSDVVSDSRYLIPQRYSLPDEFVALWKLINLRDEYNGGWMPDFTDSQVKYIIKIVADRAIGGQESLKNRTLAFKSANLRDEFLETFKLSN